MTMIAREAGPVAAETAAEQLLATRQVFNEARIRHADEVITKAITLAGRPARLSVLGHELWRTLGPTFAHLVDPGEPDSTAPGPALEFWDRALTDLARPAAPSVHDWASEGEGWRLTAHGNFRYLREERPKSVFWLDCINAAATCMYDDARRLVLLERARPLQRLMSMICRSLGVLDVHAALVAREGKGVLIVGGRGRGKTTASLDALYGGLDYLGDDSVGIAPAGGGFVGLSLYASARANPARLDRWPSMRDAWLPAGPEDEKALLRPAISHPQRMTRRAQLVAIALPVITGGPLRVAPTGPRDAFEALVWESRDVRRFRLKPNDFKWLAALARTLPSYRIEVGPDPLAVAAGLAGLLDGNTP